MIQITNIIEECYEYGSFSYFNVGIEIPKEILIPIITINIIRKGNAHKEIDKVFNSDKEKYIEAYQNSACYENIVYDSENCETVIYAKKLAGIYESNTKENDFSDIIKIGRKAFNKIYRNISNKGPVQVEHIKKYLDKTYAIGEETLVVIYLLGLEDIDIILPSIELEYVQHVIEFYGNYDTRDNDFKLTEKEYKTSKKDIESLRKLLGLDKGIHNLGDIITSALATDLNNHNKRCDMLSQPHKKVYCSNDLEEKNIDKYQVYDLMTYVTSYTDLFFQFKLNCMNLFRDSAISQKEIDYILYNVNVHRPTLDNDDLLKMYAISSFFIFGLYKEYKYTRDKYLKECTEDYVVENEKIKKQLLELTSEARDTKRIYEEKTTLINNEKKELLKEIERLKKENNRLQNQVEEYKEAKKENIKLRNYVFSNSQSVNNEDDEEIIEDEIDIKVFEGKKIAVLGGSTNWINKMKEVLPNAIYATSDTKNSSLDFIDKDTYVFINTTMGHEFYNKIQSITNKLHIDYNYISNPNKRTITNVNQSLKTMIDILKQK